MANNDIIAKFKEQDIYALICSYLFDCCDVPQYSMICELAYLLDTKSFINLIKYFEGQEIKIPTKEEFQSCIKVLLLYVYHEVEGMKWKEALELAGFKTSEGRSAHNKLQKLVDVMNKYNYGNRIV
jgi:hypothetical protein